MFTFIFVGRLLDVLTVTGSRGVRKNQKADDAARLPKLQKAQEGFPVMDGSQEELLVKLQEDGQRR